MRSGGKYMILKQIYGMIRRYEQKKHVTAGVCKNGALFAAVLFVAIAAKAPAEKGVKTAMMMSLSEAKKVAVEAVNVDYARARDILIGDTAYRDSNTVAALSWQEAWIARIVNVRRENAGLIDGVYRILQGDPGYKSGKITGKFTVMECALAVVGKGSQALPVLVEFVWKIHDRPYGSRETSVAFAALNMFGDKDVLPVLRHLAESSAPVDYRHSAVSGLGFFRDSPSAGLLLMMVENGKEPVQLRVAALNAYAGLGADDVYDKASVLLLDKKQPLELRRQAIYVLTGRKETEIIALFNGIVGNDDDVEIHIAVADAMRFHNDEQSVDLLRKLKEKNSDSTLDMIIDDTVEYITAGVATGGAQ